MNAIAGSMPRPEAPPEWFAKALANTPAAHIVQAAGSDVEWLEWGDRTRPTIVLLHGILAHAAWWRSVAGILCQQWHVIALSWPGMGASQWQGRYNSDLFTRTLNEFAATIGLFDHDRRPIIAAHSFGAVVALCAVGQESRFGGLIMIDRAIEAHFTGDKIIPSPTRRRFADVAEARARYSLFPAETAPDYVIDQLVADSLCAAEGGGYHWRQDPMLLRDISSTPDLAAQLAAALCPIAFVRGAMSEAFNAAREVRNRAITPPGTPHLAIPNAGHHVLLQNPPALAQAIATLATQWTRSSAP